MSTFRADPLLGLAKVLLTFFMVTFVIGIVSLGLGTAAMLAMKAAVTAKLLENGAPAHAFWAIVSLMPIVAALLMLLYRFAEKLRAIVRTVEQGDPFIPENATRLRTMAWLALAIQLASVPIGAIAAWIESSTEKMGDIQVTADVSTNGLLLALVLFILARVFKTGAQMREELEGTV